MEPNKGDCLEKINRQLREKGLMELDSIGDHTKGEIEILEIVEINEDPDFRGYCMVKFESLVKDKESGSPKKSGIQKNLVLDLTSIAESS